MATGTKKVIKRVSFLFMQKLAAAVSLLSLIVVTAAGVMGGAQIVTITARATGVILIVVVITRIIVKILESYEEMNSGKG